MKKTSLLNLYARNRAVQGRGFTVKADAAEATVYVYDVIVDSDLEAEWFGGVSPRAFALELARITAPVVHLRINSPGGSVFGARAIEQTIREHGSRFVAHVDGLAASAASVLMLAADEIEIAPGAMVMIHNSWSVVYGNASDMTDMAAVLEKVDGTLAQSYAAHTGQPLDTITGWMAAETWFTADEAVAAGLAHRLAGSEPATQARAGWDLSAFQHAPAQAAALPGAAAAAPVAAPAAPAAVEDVTPDAHRDRQRQRLRLVALQPNG